MPNKQGNAFLPEYIAAGCPKAAQMPKVFKNRTRRTKTVGNQAQRSVNLKVESSSAHETEHPDPGGDHECCQSDNINQIRNPKNHRNQGALTQKRR